MATLNTGHALYGNIISCAPFYATPSTAQRIDIAPGGTTISLTKWVGHANGVEGPEATGTETAANIDTSALSSGHNKISIGLVFDVVTTPGFGSTGDNFLVTCGDLSLRYFNNGLRGRKASDLTSSYTVGNGSTEVVAVVTFDSDQSTFGTARLYVGGTLRQSISSFPTGTKPTTVTSAFSASDGSVIKRLEVVWNKQLSDAEVTSWSADPYAIVASGGGGSSSRRLSIFWMD